jgi:hypothetical protein
MTDQPRNEVESAPELQKYEPPTVEDIAVEDPAFVAAGVITVSNPLP